MGAIAGRSTQVNPRIISTDKSSMGLIRKLTSISTLGAVNYRSGQEKAARHYLDNVEKPQRAAARAERSVQRQEQWDAMSHQAQRRTVWVVVGVIFLIVGGVVAASVFTPDHYGPRATAASDSAAPTSTSDTASSAASGGATSAAVKAAIVARAPSAGYMFHRAYYGGYGMRSGLHVVVSFTGDAALEACQVVSAAFPSDQVIVEGVGGDMRARTKGIPPAYCAKV